MHLSLAVGIVVVEGLMIFLLVRHQPVGPTGRRSYRDDPGRLAAMICSLIALVLAITLVATGP